MRMLIDSYSESNYSTDRDTRSYPGGPFLLWQSFSGRKGTLDSCKLYLKKTAGVTGTAYVKLYQHTGTFGVSSNYGSLLATLASFDISTLSTSYQLVTFNFTGAGRYNMSAGTKYILALNNGNSGAIWWGMDNTSPTHPGNAGYDYAGAAPTPANDMCFYIYAIVPNSMFAFF